MPLRRLLHQLFHNEQFIQKLSESAPMRFLARLTALQYHKASDIFYKTLESKNAQHYLRSWQERIDQFKSMLGEEYKKSLEDQKSKDRLKENEQRKPSK